MRLRWLVIISLLMPLTSCNQSKNEFTITWKNIDGSVLDVNENVPRGTKPSYQKGEPKYGPTREEGSSKGTTYYFSGWDSELEEVTEDKTYTATYSTKPNYDVKWVNDDGEVLQHLEYVVEGYKPTYSKALPSKQHEGTTYYAFAGWDNEQHVITSDTAYTATYDDTTQFNDYDCDGLLDYLDPNYKSPHNDVTYQYEKDKGKFDFAFDYYDYFINQDPKTYSPNTAKCLAALNLDAFYTGHITFPHEKDVFDNKKYIYERLGCDHIEEFFLDGYQQNNEPDDIGGAIMAHHTVKANSSVIHSEIDQDYNIFFVTVKASRKDNIPLWRSDLDIGSSDSSYNDMTGTHPLWTDKDYHKGFFISSNRVKDQVDTYLANSEFDSLPNKILVISGHSRGAVMANYIAKEYKGNANYKKIFAYTFGSPNYYFGSADTETNYKYIHNLVNDDDLTVSVLPTCFNGKRFGNDIHFSISSSYASQYSKFTSHPYNAPSNIPQFIEDDVKPVIPSRDIIYKVDESEGRCFGYSYSPIFSVLAKSDYNEKLELLGKYGIAGDSNSPYHLYYDGNKEVTGYNCPFALIKIVFSAVNMPDISISDALKLLDIFDNYRGIFNAITNKLGIDIEDPLAKVAYPHQMSTYYVMADNYIPTV